MKNILIGSVYTRYLAGMLLIFALQPAAPAAQSVFKTEPGVDRPGYDILNVELDVADHRACQALCVRNEECRAYTYVKPGVQGTAARCYLKAKVPIAKCNSCCTSGVRKDPRQPDPRTPSCRDSSSQAQLTEPSRAAGLSQTEQMQAAEAVTGIINSMTMQSRPDLVIQKYWTEKDAASGIVYFNWLVQNIGSAHAKESILAVSCKQMDATHCPWGDGPYSSKIKSLAPAKAGLAPEKDFAASDVISLGMDPPTASARFIFTAVIDAPGQVPESNETNNQSVNEYISPGQIHRSATAFTIEANTDRTGGDYRREWLDSFDVDMCQAICSGEQNCQAFTLVRHTTGGVGATCLLKKEVTPPRRDGCCTSGVKINNKNK